MITSILQNVVKLSIELRNRLKLIQTNNEEVEHLSSRINVLLSQLTGLDLADSPNLVEAFNSLQDCLNSTLCLVNEIVAANQGNTLKKLISVNDFETKINNANVKLDRSIQLFQVSLQIDNKFLSNSKNSEINYFLYDLGYTLNAIDMKSAAFQHDFPPELLRNVTEQITSLTAKYRMLCGLLEVQPPEEQSNIGILKLHMESHVATKYASKLSYVQLGINTFLYEITGSKPDVKSNYATKMIEDLSKLGLSEQDTLSLFTALENETEHSRIRDAIFGALMPKNNKLKPQSAVPTTTMNTDTTMAANPSNLWNAQSSAPVVNSTNLYRCCCNIS